MSKSTTASATHELAAKASDAAEKVIDQAQDVVGRVADQAKDVAAKVTAVAASLVRTSGKQNKKVNNTGTRHPIRKLFLVGALAAGIIALIKALRAPGYPVPDSTPAPTVVPDIREAAVTTLDEVKAEVKAGVKSVVRSASEAVKDTATHATSTAKSKAKPLQSKVNDVIGDNPQGDKK